MRTRIECFPCFIRQTLIALSQVTEDTVVREEIVKEVLSLMQHADTSKPPAYTTTFIHRLIRDRLGRDPFEKVKDVYNNLALGLYPGLKEEIQRSDDRLWTAARLAISGNVIDFGIFTSVDIEKSVRNSLESRIGVDDYATFRESVLGADSILYLLDNAGEIVFDMLLIGELCALGKKVKAVAKGSPVLNDATAADAAQVGLSGICEVIDNGSDAIGTILEWTSAEFQRQ